VSAPYVYRILLRAEWEEMRLAGQFTGSAIDRRDGFIHLSTREQVSGTIAAYFADVEDELVILEIDTASLGEKIRWETSRGGALFPHVYGVLPRRAIKRTMTADEFER
jgi:uncharacterized protein (DUF952 family)